MLTQTELKELLFAQWNLYELQRIYGVGDQLRPAMDHVQRQTRALAQTAPPPSPPGDPLARIKAAPSQWAKWLNMSDAEAQALIDGGHITRDQKDTLNNWWFTYGVKGQRLPSGQYQYATYDTGVEVLHIDTGGADAATEKASGKRVPGPSLP